MTITLTEHQYHLLIKRKAIMEKAAKDAQDAVELAKRLTETAKACSEAMADIFSQITLDSGVKPDTQFSNYSWAQKDGAYTMTLEPVDRGSTGSSEI